MAITSPPKHCNIFVKIETEDCSWVSNIDKEAPFSRQILHKDIKFACMFINAT